MNFLCSVSSNSQSAKINHYKLRNCRESFQVSQFKTCLGCLFFLFIFYSYFIWPEMKFYRTHFQEDIEGCLPSIHSTLYPLYSTTNLIEIMTSYSQSQCASRKLPLLPAPMENPTDLNVIPFPLPQWWFRNSGLNSRHSLEFRLRIKPMI